MSKRAVIMMSATLLLLAPRVAAAQTDPAMAPPLPLPPASGPATAPAESQPPRSPSPSSSETEAPPAGDPNQVRYEARAPTEPREEPEQMSEGRRIVVAWNTGFQWGLAPGIVFSNEKTSFVLGARFGYGFDTGNVIVVPGVRLAGYFTDPNVYLGMPVMKLVVPIDRFAPFVEAGAGIGYVAGYELTNKISVDGATGLALLVGGGFMIHFTARFGLGVEGTYQTVTGTDFKGFGIGPILALAF